MTAAPAATRFFTGQFEHTVDSVNRLVIPAKWRTGESEEFFLMARDEHSITVLTVSEMAKLTQGIDADPKLSNREKRDRRRIFSSASQVTCDRQGRVTLDANLLRRIGVRDRVVLAGFAERFEIWNPKAWTQQKSDLDRTRGTTLEELGI